MLLLAMDISIYIYTEQIRLKIEYTVDKTETVKKHDEIYFKLKLVWKLKIVCYFI